MRAWLARILEWSLSEFFTNYSSALRYYAPGVYEAANMDVELEEGFYG